MIRLLIADDHPMVLRGLKDVFEDEADIVVEAEAENGRRLLEQVRSRKFDVVLLDLSMPGMSGLDLLKQLQCEKPKLPILVLTMHAENRYAMRALKAGASGYLTKGAPPDEILKAVRKLAAGGKYASSSMAEALVRRLDEPEDKLPHELLSDREFQVLCLIASGMTVSEIANKLSLCVNTISTYRTRVQQKMNMDNNAQLTQYAIANSLVDVP
jgi:two-component system, NarL family, invasion response regulator UvrY